MKRTRKSFTDKFKAQIALEALKGMSTLAELASKHKVHPNQISGWKKLLLHSAPEVFSTNKNQSPRSEEAITAPLYEEIGRLKMDVKWLEKKL